MKFVVVTIRNNRDKKGRRLTYPNLYDADEVHRNFKRTLLYEGGITEFGEDTEEMLMLLLDEVADKYAGSKDMRIISRADAELFIQNARSLASDPIEQVTDVDRLIAIQTKLAASVALTQEDRDALDPTNPVRGINRKEKTVAGFFGV